MYKGMNRHSTMMIPTHVGSVHHPLQRFLASQPKLYARDSLDMIGVCSWGRKDAWDMAIFSGEHVEKQA